MINILAIPVNYNSYKELYAYLDSINVAIKHCKDICIQVEIADNSTVREDFKYQFTCNSNATINLHQFANLGYFGGAFEILNDLKDISVYDYIIISNVDISFQIDFFERLSKLILDSNVGWLAPFRYSTINNQPLATGIKKKRIPRWKFVMLKLYFKMPIFVKWRWNRQKKMRFKTPSDIVFKHQEIFYGCGSCFILTKEFFKIYSKIWYPVFLYGEEIFIAELCKDANLKVLYNPDLKLDEVGSVSTGKVNIKNICKYNFEGLKYNYNKFYKKHKRTD